MQVSFVMILSYSPPPRHDSLPSRLDGRNGRLFRLCFSSILAEGSTTCAPQPAAHQFALCIHALTHVAVLLRTDRTKHRMLSNFHT